MANETQAADKPAAKAKTAAAAAGDTVAHFPTPEFELPKSAREFAERGLDQTRQFYGQFKDVAEETASAFEDSAAKAADTATAFGLKNIDYAKSNVDATFELTRKLLKTRDLAEVMELHADFAKARLDAANAHARAMSEWSSKVAAEAAEPFKGQFAKSFEQFRSYIPV